MYRLMESRFSSYADALFFKRLYLWFHAMFSRHVTTLQTRPNLDVHVAR
jgi:hypothetical protein